MKKYTTMITVRHGETEWNLVGKQQGHLNSSLTKLGIKQAEALAKELATKKIDIIYSSDLGRATQTAKIISNHLSLKFLTDLGLRERNLGTMQGLTKKEFAKKFPKEAAKFNTGNPDYILPTGESARQRYERCINCAENLAHQHIGKTILIVAHGGVLNSFFYKALNIPLTEPRHFSLFNASINTFSISGGCWRLETWGEIHHLKKLKTLDDN